MHDHSPLFVKFLCCTLVILMSRDLDKSAVLGILSLSGHLGRLQEVSIEVQGSQNGNHKNPLGRKGL